MKKIGFTLIELLVVISLIGILMGILLVSYQGTRKSARDGKRKADLEQIRSALEMCRTDKGSYPTALPSGGGIDCSAYLPSVPTDPLAPAYRYRYNRVSPNSYYLCACLEVGGWGPVSDCGGSCADGCESTGCNYKKQNP